jgi:hypothetical protein
MPAGKPSGKIREIDKARLKFWKEVYPKFSFEEKVSHWAGTLDRRMRWNADSGADEYAIFSAKWYATTKEDEPDIDRIIDSIFETHWKDRNKAEYLKRIQS